MSHTGHIFQINISGGGVPKNAQQRASIDSEGVAGDKHRDLIHHGGEKRAVCVYALERILALQGEGHPIYPGSVGENITIAGVDWDAVTPGSRLHLGDAVVLEVTQYTEPCNNIRGSFSDGNSNRIHQNKHAGWSRVYARVLQAGDVKVGDKVKLGD